jgi:hypothetical protein
MAHVQIHDDVGADQSLQRRTDVVWPAGILGGLLRNRQRCLTNSSAWSGGSFGERPASAMVPTRSA